MTGRQKVVYDLRGHTAALEHALTRQSLTDANIV